MVFPYREKAELALAWAASAAGDRRMKRTASTKALGGRMEDGQNPKRDISAEISGYHLAGRAGEAGPVAFDKKGAK
jgi:hypothetical protein